MSSTENPSWIEFIRNLYPNFNGTTFSHTFPDGRKLGFNVSRNPDPVYWDDLMKKYKEAIAYDPKIQLTIGFCIDYHRWIQQPLKVKEIFGQKISNSFPVPEEVTNFFKFRDVFQLCKPIQSITHKLQSVESETRRLKDLLELSVAVLKELRDEVESLKRELADIQTNFQKADKNLTALKKLLEANSGVTALFGENLAVISPEVSSLMEKDEFRRRAFLDQMTDLNHRISSRESMVFDQNRSILSIQEQLDKQVHAETRLKSDLLEAKNLFFDKLKKIGRENIPPEFRHFFEATAVLSRHFKSMLSAEKVTADLVVRQSVSPAFLENLFHREIPGHFVVQEAYSVLSNHLRMFLAKKLVHSRIEAYRIEESRQCAICYEKKSAYFVLGCGHGLYCQKCITDFRQNSCPSCRKPILSFTDSTIFNGRIFEQ
jgi:hypothetical protein